VSVDGISYIKSYREDFGAQIQQLGLDSLIAHLEEGQKSGDISKTTVVKW
jgi:ABC-type transporter MlaC component